MFRINLLPYLSASFMALLLVPTAQAAKASHKPVPSPSPVPSASPSPVTASLTSTSSAAADEEFKHKLSESVQKTDKSIKIIRQQITESANAPFLPDLYVQLGDLLSQKSITLY
jgi:hypothetical protein